MEVGGQRVDSAVRALGYRGTSQESVPKRNKAILKEEFIDIFKIEGVRSSYFS